MQGSIAMWTSQQCCTLPAMPLPPGASELLTPGILARRTLFDGVLAGALRGALRSQDNH
jgi:hypothetical protein